MDANEDNYNEQFEALTEGMQYEKLLDEMANRAHLAQIIARHSAEIYKAGREAGLPRDAAGQMALSYFQFETSPSAIYMVGGEG
jgi:hypothetical protein